MKKIKRHELQQRIRNKPYLYTIYGTSMVILSPLIILISSVVYLKDEGFLRTLLIGII